MNAEPEPIVVAQTYDVPMNVVWEAITDKDQMRQWFFEQIEDFQPQVGFETQFDVEFEDQCFRHLWKVTEVDPGKRIAYRWQYEGYPGDSTVIWELAETPEGANLKITHKGQETFPQDNPIFSRENGQAGWEYFLNESLSDYLSKQVG